MYHWKAKDLYFHIILILLPVNKYFVRTDLLKLGFLFSLNAQYNLLKYVQRAPFRVEARVKSQVIIVHV